MPLLYLKLGLHRGHFITFARGFGMQGFHLIRNGIRLDFVHKRAASRMAFDIKLHYLYYIDRIDNKLFTWLIYSYN